MSFQNYVIFFLSVYSLMFLTVGRRKQMNITAHDYSLFFVGWANSHIMTRRESSYRNYNNNWDQFYLLLFLKFFIYFQMYPLSIDKVLQFKDVVVIFLYVSPLLSRCSAGESAIDTLRKWFLFSKNNISFYFVNKAWWSKIFHVLFVLFNCLSFYQLFIVIEILVGQIVGISWLLGRYKWIILFIIHRI